jgi:hypothetical protein
VWQGTRGPPARIGESAHPGQRVSATDPLEPVLGFHYWRPSSLADAREQLTRRLSVRAVFTTGLGVSRGRFPGSGLGIAIRCSHSSAMGVMHRDRAATAYTLSASGQIDAAPQK